MQAIRVLEREVEVRMSECEELCGEWKNKGKEERGTGQRIKKKKGVDEVTETEEEDSK